MTFEEILRELGPGEAATIGALAGRDCEVIAREVTALIESAGSGLLAPPDPHKVLRSLTYSACWAAASIIVRRRAERVWRVI